jgi:outer membrane protein insertion porin family
LQGGHVQATSGDLRMIDHYFLGPNLVRGFASAGIGPRDIGTTLNPTDPTTNALGGTTYFGGTLEVQFPIFGLPRDVGLRGAVFADAGTLFNYEGGNKDGASRVVRPEPRHVSLTSPRTRRIRATRPAFATSNVIRSSIGVSLLWQSPLGPIRFDYAYALSKDDGYRDPASGVKLGGDKAAGLPLFWRHALLTRRGRLPRPGSSRCQTLSSFLWRPRSASARSQPFRAPLCRRAPMRPA